MTRKQQIESKTLYMLVKELMKERDHYRMKTFELRSDCQREYARRDEIISQQQLEIGRLMQRLENK